MGAGAPKKVDSIPIHTVVSILAHEANVNEAMENLADAVKECLSGSDNPVHWIQMEKWRDISRSRMMHYFNSIGMLIRNQNS